ncbi:uracil-DNA glycosylase family protein [Novosphingobium sp.]|uniref:uracil-DNA glycosylase family protein n=1 Tax=Novosphingobium sp. TaxID=1874826 RepID=UPI00352B83B3
MAESIADIRARAPALVAAAFDWWRDAGVDCAFVDDPQDWLAEAHARDQAEKGGARPAPARKAPETPAVAEIPRIGGPRDQWPATLAEFPSWWLSEPSLAPAGLPRVPPAGPVQADLMVLVAMPEEDDSEALLSGRSGRLLDAMLAAMGLSRSQVYIAAALPARIAAPDWARLAETGMGAILAHHVTLAAPRRMLVFGRSGISTLMGNDSPNNAANLDSFNHDRGRVPAASAHDLEAMLARPALKAGIWSRWLEWTTDGD